nr:MAG TPA: hypothetical protein [Caudoviricetes sp.]
MPARQRLRGKERIGRRGKLLGSEYTIRKYFFGEPTPQVVAVTFQLAYHDWLKLEKSDEWHCFLEALEDFQRE